MKKITLLLFIMLSCVSGFAQFTENFDSGMTLPSGWTVVNGGDIGTWEILDMDDELGFTAHSGNNAAGIFYDEDDNHDDYLVTPAITVTAGLNDYLTFWGRSLDPGYPEEISVKVSTGGLDATDFTITLDPIAAPVSGEDYEQFSYDLSAYVGQTIYIGFYSSTVDKFLFEIDDVVNEALPACMAPNGFAVSELNAESATLSWSSTGNLFQIEYGEIGFTPGTGTILTVEGTPLTLEELAPETDYQAYIVRDCGSGNLSESKTVSFSTPALPPSNDVCGTASVLTVANSFEAGMVQFTSTGATTDEDLEPECASSYANDVWFTVVVPEDGNLTIETQQVDGSDNDDTIIEVFSGSCGNLVSIECNDDNEDEDDTYFSKLSLTGLTPGDTIYVAVWQYYFDLFGDPLETGSFAISAYNENLSVKENGLSGLKTYPNPVESILNLSYKEELRDINVYNLLGQRVFSKTLNATNSQVDLSGLTAGTYMVKLSSGNDVETIKILKK